MRNVQRLLSGLGLLGAVVVVGCTSDDTSTEPVGSGEARIVLVADGSASANMHLVVTNDATAEVALDKSVTVDAGASMLIEVALDAASYSLHLEAFTDDSQTHLISSGDAQLDLKADLATEIFLSADTDGDASAGAGVTVSINDQPNITGVTVRHSVESVTIDVQVAGSGDLNFFWSGFGIDGAVKGTSSLTISNKADLDVSGDVTAHLVVQNSAGATASIDIDLTAVVDGKECVFCSSETTSAGDLTGGGGATEDLHACFEARVECDLACKAEFAANPVEITAQLACMTDCGLDLASCEAGAN